MAGPLEGIRVVEMGSLLAGPFCGQLLGDFGAEVIKVEPPGKGDPMREWGAKKDGVGLWWPVIARNKKSVTLNLREARGQEIAKGLIASADVLVENFRPGTMERWGLGYDTLSQSHPGLVMARVSGFGQTGPYSRRAGFGSVGEAVGGLRYIVGEPGRPPVRVGIALGDALAGTLSALGVLMALYRRDARGGTGQVVDVGIYEAVLAYMECMIPEYALAGKVRERTGAWLPGVAPSNIYPSAEGEWLVLGANADKVFARLAAAMGRPELADDPRFASHAARGQHAEELDGLIAEWTSRHAIAELVAVLDQAGVPASKIFTAADMLSDPHFAARQNIVEVVDPRIGKVPMQNVVPRMSASPGSVRSTGPALGEDNAAILSGVLGIPESELGRLAEEGIV